MEPKVTAQHEAEMRDLLGAFALGAVNAEEAAAVRQYLMTNPAAQAELAELMAGVDALALTAEPLDPPPALRDRIAAATLADDLAVAPATRHPSPIAHHPSPSFWSRATPWAIAAAALLLLAAGLLIWNLQLRNQLTSVPPPEVIALAPTDAAPQASGEVRYLPAQSLLLLDVQDLPPLAADQVYEVWLIGADGPVPAGTFDQSSDQHAIVADRGQFDTLAITAEPGPLGTAAPTGEIVATAPL